MLTEGQFAVVVGEMSHVVKVLSHQIPEVFEKLCRKPV